MRKDWKFGMITERYDPINECWLRAMIIHPLPDWQYAEGYPVRPRQLAFSMTDFARTKSRRGVMMTGSIAEIAWDESISEDDE